MDRKYTSPRQTTLQRPSAYAADPTFRSSPTSMPNMRDHTDEGNRSDSSSLSSDDESTSKRSRRRLRLGHVRKPPGLRKISQHVIDALRSSEKDLTYKQMSDLVTARNGEKFVRKALDCKDSHVLDRYFDSVPIEQLEDMPETRRALDNYKRRIYDAWSVLRAANIIEASGDKKFRYNRDVLETSTMHGTPSTLRHFEMSDGSFASPRGSGSYESYAMGSPASRPPMAHNNQEVYKFVSETEAQCKTIYSRIQKRLAKLHELNQANISLKRLIKRNRKQEAKMARKMQRKLHDGEGEFPEPEVINKCKMPFYLAKYQPPVGDDESDFGSNPYGLELGDRRTTIKSRHPIKCYPDYECLRNMDLADSDEETVPVPVRPAHAPSNRSAVSRSFYETRTAGIRRKNHERFVPVSDRAYRGGRADFFH